MKIGGIVLVILGLLCLPQGLIFIVPGVALFQRPAVPAAALKMSRRFLRS